MVLEFCSECRVLVMRRRETSFAHVSLMLLASCCLVICTGQSQEENHVVRPTARSTDRFLTQSVLYRNAAAELYRDADLLRLASEFCAAFPDECAPVSDHKHDGVFKQRPTGFADMLAPKPTPPWPSKRLYELPKEEEALQLITATNLTARGSLDNESDDDDDNSDNWTQDGRRTSSNDATRSRGEARFGAKIERRAPRDPHRLGRLRYRWQQQNMGQHIVAALPSAFAFAGRTALVGVGASGGRTRSTRQQRSDDEQQLPRHWISLHGGPTAPDQGQSTSTTSGHRIIQAGLHEEAAIQCSVKQFRFTATKTDEQGNRCSGQVEASICYGGCDTGEIADWLFPGKKSIHKVCRHGRRIRRRLLLNNCNNDTISDDDSLRIYHYVDAQNCVCKKCSSVDTTCLGTMSRPYLQTLHSGGGGDDD